MEILAVKNLSFSYPDAASPALENISFSVSEGEFIVLCGESGCGKTTLLRLLKRELAPAGKISGEISLFDKPQSELDERASASEIGYVMQNPETQIVTDKVWHELAFGMEGLGFESEKIRIRAGEMAGYFGIDSWFRADTASLSGGQKQLLSLASVMALSPRLLLLDEPTAQLDPVAASDFISDIYRLNRDLGVTVIIAEHRLEELLPIADRAAVMEDGRIVSFDSPRAVCNALGSRPISAGFPAASRISAALADSGKSPLTVREGRRFLSSLDIRRGASVPADKPSDGESENAVEMKNVWFRYERNTPDILRGLNLSLKRGEIFSLLGGNGAGKTTVLKVLSGIEKPYRGKIKLLGKNIKDYRGNELHFHNVALLPQNVRDVFLRDTVESDLRDMCRVLGYSAVQADEKISAVSEKLGIFRLFGKHPSTPPVDIAAFLTSHRHSRIPIYRGDLDHIVGVIHVRSYLRNYLHQGTRTRLRPLMNPPVFVRPDTPVDEVLRQMSSHRIQLAIVQDENGKTLGVLTVEDILEELVGEIQDEEDLEGTVSDHA